MIWTRLNCGDYNVGHLVPQYPLSPFAVLFVPAGDRGHRSEAEQDWSTTGKHFETENLGFLGVLAEVFWKPTTLIESLIPLIWYHLHLDLKNASVLYLN